MELQNRVVAGITDIIAGIEPCERVFLVVHGGVLRTLICFLNDVPLTEYTNIPMANLTLLELTAKGVKRGGRNIRNVKPEDMI